MKDSNRLFVVIAGTIIMLFAGFVYAWSILSAPIAAEFPAWNSAQLALTFTICMTCFCLGGLFAGILARFIPVGTNVRIAGALFAVGFFIASRAQSLPVLYLGYGLLCGTASGFAYNAVIGTVPKWYPGKEGLVSGVLLMGFGTSGLLIGSAYTALTPEAIGAWRISMLWMGLLMAAALILASRFIRHNKNEQGELTDNKWEPSADIPPAQMLRHKSFWFFFLWASLIGASGLAIISQARPIALSIVPDLSAGSVSFLVGLISICNGLGRIIVGFLFDRFGQRRAMQTVIAFFFAGVGLISLSSAIGSLSLTVAGFIAIGLGYGGTPISSAAYTRSFFGSRYYSVNFPIVNMTLILASLGGTAAGALYDRALSFHSTYVFLLICIVMASITMLGIRKP